MQCEVQLNGLTASQRASYSPTPDAGFFTAFQTAFQQYQSQTVGAPADGAGTSTSSVSLADVLGKTQTGFATCYGISTTDQSRYAAVLNEAYANGALSDPQKFLQSLSQSDLAIVQRMHCLADTINPSGLSTEGAENLLIPDGHSVDLNHDGLDEVGLAKTIHFPPRDVPASFTDAWFQATKEMDDGGYMTHALSFFLAFHPISETGQPTVGLPTNQIDSYQKVVDNYLCMLDHYRGSLAAGQYERDQPFFSRLKELLQDAQGSGLDSNSS